MGNAEYEKVMKALKNQKGMSQAEREALARKQVDAKAQAKRFADKQARVKKLHDKKRKGHGGDDVIDSGMFSS